jgi:hypothetical protein
MIENIILKFADNGFAYAVAIFLLYKGYTQDKEYLDVLHDIKTEMCIHVKEQEQLIEMIAGRK